MTKMAAMPMYGKNFKNNLLLRNKKADDLVLDLLHRVLEYYQVYLNGDAGLT